MVSWNWNSSPMTAACMLRIVSRIGDAVEIEGNVVQFRCEQVPITLIFDENADRMRLISAVRSMDEVKDDEVQRAMEANFHSALDARYCISDGILWAAFIHPLSDLSNELLESAIRQVAIANLSFGSDYTSGLLKFGG